MADVKVTVKADLIDREARAKFEAFEKQVNAKALASTLKLDTDGALKSFNEFVKSVRGTTVKVKLETDAVSTQGGTDGGKNQRERLLKSLPSARTLAQTRAQLRTDNLISKANQSGVDVSSAEAAMARLTAATQQLGNAEKITAVQAKALTNAKNEQAAAFVQATATVKQSGAGPT